MSTVRNILICCGMFWLSLWGAALLTPSFSKLNDGIVYGDGVLSALAMGVMSSMGRTLAAVVAGVCVALIISSRKPEIWAVIVGALYVIASPVRHHWGFPATGWDRLWQGVDLIFPCLACILAAFVVTRLRGNRDSIAKAS
jgi:uncharacterized membrane protein (DUF4010 family)